MTGTVATYTHIPEVTFNSLVFASDWGGMNNNIHMHTYIHTYIHMYVRTYVRPERLYEF